MSLRRLRVSKGGLTAEQKSAEGIVGHVVGKASEALRCRKAESTDRPSRERWLKARTRGGQVGMSLRSEKQQNIQVELDFSSASAGEAREAGREETESLSTANDPKAQPARID